jgi:glycosyltransferase involved in cell wall biosynthesis
VIKVLHISSAYSNSQLYKELVDSLAQRKILATQQVFVPVRSKTLLGRNSPTATAVKVNYSYILRPYHKVWFGRKIKAVFSALLAEVDVSQVDLVHSHFLFSDGAVALKLKREFGIPYITAVRNTDINTFFKYRPDLKRIAYEILNEAEAVVCLNKAYKNKLLQKAPYLVCPNLENKIHVIPNGVEQSWLKNTHTKTDDPKVINCIYVGDLSKNKNIESTISALTKLKEHYPVSFSVVGCGGNGENRFLDLQKKYDFIKYYGRVTNRGELREIMRRCDIFIMPSFNETFGLTFIEALSQGLPIIYSKGQGVDGYFDDLKVGVKVDPQSIKEIQDAIVNIYENLTNYREHCNKSVIMFDWKVISLRYHQLYQDVLAPTI